MTAREEFDARVVARARDWLGTPYVHQGSLQGVGTDCLGLVRGVWRALLGDEPEAFEPYSPDWAEATGRESLLEAASRHMTPVDPVTPPAGAVVLFRWRPHLPAKHCAIVASADTFVHAHDGAAVAEVPYAPFWRRRTVAAFLFPLPE